MIKKIVIKGAKEHNLKNISLEIPKDKFVVITGPHLTTHTHPTPCQQWSACKCVMHAMCLCDTVVKRIRVFKRILACFLSAIGKDTGHRHH